MSGFLDKARDWRQRATELRRTAERMLTPAARSSLLDRAASLDHHAENLEQVATKFDRIREAAADTRPLQTYIPRRLAPARGQGDD